jgi:hypothetical protein
MTKPPPLFSSKARVSLSHTDSIGEVLIVAHADELPHEALEGTVPGHRPAVDCIRQLFTEPRCASAW